MIIDIQEVTALRKKLWEDHPIVCKRALLPTKAMQKVFKHVDHIARAHRASVAWWAPPLTGKSHCIEALCAHLAEKLPGSGIAVLDAKDVPGVPGEGSLWIDFLQNTLDYQGSVPTNVSRIRNQAYKALYAIAAESGRLFFIIDEAQALREIEFRWLKSALNKLARRKIDVVTIVFGQVELVRLSLVLKRNARSDLHARFVARLYELDGVQNAKGLTMLLKACDEASEYPKGSALSYTRFLLPLAFDSGLRLSGQANLMWNALQEAGHGPNVGMNAIADTLSWLAWRCRDKDSKAFVPDAEDWLAAAEEALPEQMDASTKKVVAKLLTSNSKALGVTA